MKKILTLLLSLLLALPLAVASGKSEEAQAPVKRDVVRMCMTSDIDSLDPFKAAAFDTLSLLKNIYEGLLTFDTDGSLQPSLATSYTVSPDGLTYTFNLRKDVTFHDGTPFTSKDVLYTYDRYAGLDGNSRLLDEFSIISAISAPDPYTVKVTLDHPSSTFLPLAIQPIVKAGYTENATAPIGTGPYRFKAYVPGQQVDLVRNDSYWGKEPAIARVEVYIMTDSAAMVSAFQSGQLDFGLVSADLFAPLQQDFVLEADPMNMADLIALNNKRKPFDDPRVRQAIYYGIDRKEIIDGVFSSKAVPMYTNVSPAMDAYCNTELAESYPHDLAKARALLTQAGYPDGFRMTLTVPANYFQHVDTAQILVSQLAKLGIDVTIDSVEWGTWLQNVYTDRNYQATVIGLTGKVDPYAVMFRYTSGYKKNFFNYTDDAYDALLKQASVATDQTKYVSLLKQAQQLATKDAAAIWICDPEMTVAVRKNLKGYKFYFAGYYDFASLYFE